jgi:hypothetical protein
VGFSHRVAQVGVVHNIVPIKNTPGLMTTDCHCDSLWYTSSDHIADSGSPEVVENIGDSCFFTGRPPLLTEVPMVDMPQIFLPFAVGKNGGTLYEQVQKNPGFLLGDGGKGGGV